MQPKDFATSIEPGQSAHPCSLTKFYTIGWPTLNSHLDIPKMILDSSKMESGLFHLRGLITLESSQIQLLFTFSKSPLNAAADVFCRFISFFIRHFSRSPSLDCLSNGFLVRPIVNVVGTCALWTVLFVLCFLRGLMYKT